MNLKALQNYTARGTVLISKWAHEHRFFFLQCAGALSALIGVADYSVPVALIIGGAGALVVVERQGKDGSLADLGAKAIAVVGSLVKAQAKGNESVPIAAVLKELS
jgi:hypothetical protein